MPMLVTLKIALHHIRGPRMVSAPIGR